MMNVRREQAAARPPGNFRCRPCRLGIIGHFGLYYVVGNITCPLADSYIKGREQVHQCQSDGHKLMGWYRTKFQNDDVLLCPSLAFHVFFPSMIIWPVATLEDSTWHLWRPPNIQLITSSGAKHDAWLVIKRSEVDQ
jgi:hypothetical protein